MDFSPETIFISYSRKDGREFAEAFERRLEQEAGIHAWRDLKSIEGGEDTRPQVLRAIESVKHLVLILSRRALESDWVKREWTHARMAGRKVSPVLADRTIKRSDLPGWIRRAEVYDIAEPERWRMLVRVLEGPGETRRVLYMSGDLPDDFVLRPVEYNALKDAVMSASSDGPVGVTTALRGAGGYGKTTLASALCCDPEVRFEFSDGILRVEIGKERNDVTGLILDLIEELDPGARRPGFQDVETAAEHLGQLLGEARLLLVIDDVWREAQLRPFLRGGPNCVRLVTTRLSQVLPRSAKAIVIDEMRAEEALRLISANLAGAANPVARRRLARLAERLGRWAQMISIANGWIRDRLSAGEPLAKAVERFEQRLMKRGLAAFDPEDEAQRNRAIRACVEASLEDLGANEIGRLCELAILPEDESIPLDVAEVLWAETAGLDEDDADMLVQRFHALSLLQDLERNARTLRLHDNMIWYLRDRIGLDGCRTANAAMVRALRARCDGDWTKLPPGETYGWRFLTRHLRAAGQDAEADGLLVDYAWIKGKLRATRPLDLFDDYLPESRNEGTRLVGRAIALSLTALATNPRELPRQIFGRLGDMYQDAAKAIVAAARQDPDFSPRPRWPGLTPPGAERLRLVGHEGDVSGAVFSPDCAQIVTASRDRTARIWDVSTGQEIVAFRGHEKGVNSATFSPDGMRVVTGSDDGTARLWDASTAQEIATLRGHEGAVEDAAFSPDGMRVVTASDDGTARLWDASTRQEIATLRGHEQEVNSAVFSPNGNHIVTSSRDHSARIWDASTGLEIKALRGHTSYLTTAAFSPDGARIVTSSDDRTARIWNAWAGGEIVILRGHEILVTSADFSPDGALIITASFDNTARLWDAETGRQIAALRGHDNWLYGAGFSPDGALAVTVGDDKIARIWDMATMRKIGIPSGHKEEVISAAFSPDNALIVTASGPGLSSASSDNVARVRDAVTGLETATLHGHKSIVCGAAFSPNGTRIVTASYDRTARLWDASTAQEIAALDGHEQEVKSAAYSPDGARIVTASGDRTARVWDAATAREIIALRGHEEAVNSAVFSPDGGRIATASWDKTARIWDSATGKEIAVLRGHAPGTNFAAFSADGNRIVTASRDHTARIWETATGQEMAALSGHEGLVTGAAFSADGNRVVTASYDSTARVWEAATGKQITLIVLDARVTALAVGDGVFALGDALGRVHVFEAREFLWPKGSAP